MRLEVENKWKKKPFYFFWPLTHQESSSYLFLRSDNIKKLFAVPQRLLHVHLFFSDFLFNFANVATSTAYKMKDSVKETVEKQVGGVLVPFLGKINT